MTVLGLDSCPSGWAVVVADDSGFVEVFVASTVAEAERVGIERWGIDAMVIDIPIGVPDSGPRQADVEARRFIKPRGSSVFSTPVRAALEASDYDAARAASIAATGGTSLSKQAWAMGAKILDVDEFAPNASVTVREGHPEVSFRAMAGEPIEHYKKTFSGATKRQALLAAEGIELPWDSVEGVKGAASDDVLDAAAMAWTARRIVAGQAESLPAEPESFSDGWPSAIWF